MAVHVAGLLQRRPGPPLRERDLDRQRPHPGDAARPGRGAPGAPPAARRTSSSSAARATSRGSPGRRRTTTARVLHWLENEGVIRAQARPDHRPLAHGAEGASRLSRCAVAALGLRSRWLSAGRRRRAAQQAAPIALDPPRRRPGRRALLVDARRVGAVVGRPAAPSRSRSRCRAGCASTARRASGSARATQAARAACPTASRIGFGRFIVTVRDYASWGGQAELAWSIDASLGPPRRRGDAASVVLTRQAPRASTASTRSSRRRSAPRCRRTVTPSAGSSPGGRREASSCASRSCPSQLGSGTGSPPRPTRLELR